MAYRQGLVSAAVLVGLAVASGSAWSIDPLERERLTGFRQVGPNVYERVTGIAGSRGIASTGTGVQVSDLHTLQGKAGPMQVTAKSNLGMPKVRLAGAHALKALAWAGPAAGVVGTGLLLWDLFDEYRIRPDEAGGLLRDEGVSPETVTAQLFKVNTAGGPWQVSKEAACAYKLNESYPENPTVVVYGGGTITTTYVYAIRPTDRCETDWSKTCVQTGSVQQYGGYWCSNNNGTGSGTTFLGSIIDQQGQTTRCPASIDPFDPAFSLPEGLPPDEDGLCRRARGHWDPITPEAAATTSSPADWTGPIKEAAVDRGLQNGFHPVPDSAESSGPASQTGTPTSTTTTTGEGTRTTTTTPSYNYTYSPTTITVTTTTTTMSCVGASACTPETADETTTEESGDPPPEQRQLCEDFPEISACKELDVPAADTLPAETIPVSVSPDGGWGAGDGSCPGTITLASGITVDPFGLVCTFADGIRFIVVGFSALIATLIFIGRVD